ncbi:MAG: adenylate/guanylate cyclase domain-containing protein [Proteobacteria bacterium]|nr:adenylate/guanylate cyclase domain-containing protein [Pseudomonadota bacterium]MBU1716018.1 adenylate/guanylate cyclase domain-containing protein [Pseudomonadota bacterium]
MNQDLHHKPFPLIRYYSIYAGLGGIIFYALLFAFLLLAERQALYDQYIEGLIGKANTLYHDINRDLLQPQKVTLENFNPDNSRLNKELRAEIEEIVRTDFTLAKVKVFNNKGLVLYDHADRQKEGKLYDAINETGFQTALQGEVSSKLEHEADGRRLMEVYLPIINPATRTVAGIIEIYEDVTRFETQVYKALKQALMVPTIIFLLFNIVLFLIVVKAGRIISFNTTLLLAIRHNMEKYLSRSAIEAIYNAVTEKQELFRGEKQSIVIVFSDIRGFTAYSEHTEPEIVVKELNTILQLQAAIIHEYGGTIDKFVGDEIMAIFPAAKAAEATAAALKIVAAIHASKAITFEVGISVHSGLAVVGSIGTEERRDYTAIGDTINTGARLCSACGPGEVIISSRIFETLTDQLRCQFSLKETLKLKGKTAPIKTYSSLVPKEIIYPEPA